MAGQDVIPRATLDQLLAHRERFLIVSAEARAAYIAALDKVEEARQAAQRIVPGEHTLYGLGDLILTSRGAEERVTEAVRAAMDRAIWPYVLGLTGLKGMMDKQARDEFDRDLATDPPEVTADNVRATFREMRKNAYVIFRRGLVNVFRNLSREYRSNDGFKLGPRTVISRGVSSYGDYHTFGDADRIMHVLDGQRVGEGWYSTLAEQLRQCAKTRYQPGKHGGQGAFVMQPGELTTTYWRVKWYQNENVHLWCLRPDLLRRANRLIAEHYEEALGAGPDAAGARKYQHAKPHHHEVEDFYATSPTLAEEAVAVADLKPGMEVLEPSAGEGAIVTAILAAGITPDCVEAAPDRVETLRDMLPPGCVTHMDFLAMHPEPEFDRVIANFPFGKRADVQHCFHAFRFLKPGGRLVAIMGPGLQYREDGPTKELRSLIVAWGGQIRNLPPGSFKHAGTMTDAVMVVVDKPSWAALPAPRDGDQSALPLGAAA